MLCNIYQLSTEDSMLHGTPAVYEDKTVHVDIPIAFVPVVGDDNDDDDDDNDNSLK